MCRLFQRLQPESKWNEAINQVHFSLITKLIPVASASKGDIKVTTLWLYRDEICFMVISSLVCFTHWLTCRLIGLTSPWQFGQFRYTHISTWSCLFEWQDSEFKLHLYVVTMTTLFWEEGLHNNWIHFVVKQWNMAHATCFIAYKASLGAFANILLKGLTSSFAPPILTLVSLPNPITSCTGTAYSGSLSSNLGYASLLDGGGGFGWAECPQKLSDEGGFSGVVLCRWWVNRNRRQNTVLLWVVPSPGPLGWGGAWGWGYAVSSIDTLLHGCGVQSALWQNTLWQLCTPESMERYMHFSLLTNIWNLPSNIIKLCTS